MKNSFRILRKYISYIKSELNDKINIFICDIMVEIELKAKELTENDNTELVEMSREEIWFIKYFIQKYHPKKIVEIGVSAGGNTVNLLNWKDKDAQLFSVDIAKNWSKDETKLSGFMADEVEDKDNYKIYRGYDYLDVYNEIGNDIDLIIIDTVHVMPGEFLTYITALPQLKDGCIVIFHDIHLNMKRISNDKFNDFQTSGYCTGLLYGGISSSEKYSLQTNGISNIGCLIVDDSTRDSIKDVFRILCSRWFYLPFNLNFDMYREYVKKHYSPECYRLFCNCLDLQTKYFTHKRREKKKDLDLKKELETKDELIEVIQSELDNLKKENELVNPLQMELDSVQKENELIKSTVNWKITKPLRLISKLLK